MNNMPRQHDSHSRRTFLQTSAVAASIAGISLASNSKVVIAEEEKGKGNITILFQGDSITDAGRNKKESLPNNAAALGRGYPAMVAGELLGTNPAGSFSIYNRGISGNKVPDLKARWQKDCYDVKPDILSVLIGVNDIWHKLNGNYAGTVETYETGYRELLKETQEKLPKTKIIICEPFVLRCGAVRENWFPEFDQRQAVARKLTDEFKLTFVPFQNMFDKAAKVTGPEFWARDGVHPSVAGHMLMAHTWIEAAGL